MLSYHILVVAIDHPNVPILLQQLDDTLKSHDRVTFVFDGLVDEKVFDEWTIKKSNNRNWRFIKEPRHGCWGQILRDIYKVQLDGDYIINFDNDDLFQSGWREESERELLRAGLPDIAVFNFLEMHTDVLYRVPINCNCIVKNKPEYMHITHGRYYASDRSYYTKIISEANNVLQSEFVLSKKY